MVRKPKETAAAERCPFAKKLNIAHSVSQMLSASRRHRRGPCCWQMTVRVDNAASRPWRPTITSGSMSAQVSGRVASTASELRHLRRRHFFRDEQHGAQVSSCRQLKRPIHHPLHRPKTRGAAQSNPRAMPCRACPRAWGESLPSGQSPPLSSTPPMLQSKSACASTEYRRFSSTIGLSNMHSVNTGPQCCSSRAQSRKPLPRVAELPVVCASSNPFGLLLLLLSRRRGDRRPRRASRGYAPKAPRGPVARGGRTTVNPALEHRHAVGNLRSRATHLLLFTKTA